jgi:pyruvate/2-oxoglutarate dehydrogenase complex dihydrolipoamide acyltransferase (E2) component
LRRDFETNPWREIAIIAYKAPSDSKVYGTYEVDITNVLEYIKKKKEEGKRLTITNFATAALARTLYEDIPDINCYIQRGRFVYRDSADVFVSISVDKAKEMSGMIVHNAQELSVSEIAELFQKQIEKVRSGVESGVFSAKNAIAKIPRFVRKPAFKFVKWWSIELGRSLPFLKIPNDPFGSIMLTNIGTFGLRTGMVALFPIGKLPAVIAMGKVYEKPVVIDGEIKIRSVLPFTGTFDHRIVDGAQAGALATGVDKRLQNPEDLDGPNR